MKFLRNEEEVEASMRVDLSGVAIYSNEINKLVSHQFCVGRLYLCEVEICPKPSFEYNVPLQISICGRVEAQLN